MKYLFMVTFLAGAWLLLPIAAQAQGCYQLVGGASECDSCGYYVDTQVCSGFHSTGGASCNPLFYQLPCSSPDRQCQGLFPSRQLIGQCDSASAKAGTKKHQGGLTGIELLQTVFVPNRQGGYEDAVTFTTSCPAAGVLQ
jgi:hypothetical protein